MAFNPTLKHLTTRLDGGVIWAASTEYLADNIVIFQNASYRCLVNHTSSASFTTDLNSNKWAKLNNEINYILNGNALVDTSGWSTYADAAGTQPVDGAGGSPNVTFTRSTTTPLRGIADFNFAKDAANRQGQGVATDFVIDLADQAKVLTVSFDYEVLSGTYADSDLTVYLIADPAGTPVVIQPAGYVVQAATVGTKMRQIATFQTQASGQSYRLCLHVASTSASAYTLAVDNVVVGPQVVQYGAPVTDWVSYTPTFNGSPATSNVAFRWRRVGDSIEIDGSFQITTVNTSDAAISLPAGITIDSSKVGTTRKYVFGEATKIINAASSALVKVVTGYNTTFLNQMVLSPSSGTQLLQQAGWDSITANSDWWSIKAMIPVTGWSSTVQMSQDTDTRVVAAKVAKSGTQAIGGAGNTKLTSFSVVSDSAGLWDATNNRFNIPIAGTYQISMGANINTAQVAGAAYRVNGVVTNYFMGNDANGNRFGGSSYHNLKAGDYVEFYPYINGATTVQANEENTWLSITRVSGPSAIAASETVRARVVMSANQAFGATVFYPNLNVKTYDSHGAMSAAGVFTAPISGVYSVKMSLASDGTTSFPTSQGLNYGIEKNGASLVSLLGLIYGNGTTNLSAVAGSDSIYLNAGETIRMRCSSGVAFTAQASFNTFFAVERIGN